MKSDQPPSVKGPTSEELRRRALGVELPSGEVIGGTQHIAAISMTSISAAEYERIRHLRTSAAERVLSELG